MTRRTLTPTEAMLHLPAEWRRICDRIEQTGGGFPDGTGGDLVRELYRLAFEHRNGTPLTAKDPFDGVIRTMDRQLIRVRLERFVDATEDERTRPVMLDVFDDDDSARAILAGFLACEAEDVLAEIVGSAQ